MVDSLLAQFIKTVQIEALGCKGPDGKWNARISRANADKQMKLYARIRQRAAACGKEPYPFSSLRNEALLILGVHEGPHEKVA